MVDVDAKHSEHIIFEDNNYQIKIEHIIEPPMLTTAGFSIENNCRLNITFKSERHFDEALKIIEELADFFTLCQGFYAGIESLKLKFSNCPSTVKCLSSFPESFLDANKIYRMPFPYATIKDNLETMLQEWIYMPEDRKHVEVILASLMSDNWNMPFVLIFFAYSQVLEVLSKANVNLRSLPKAQYKKYRKLIFESINDEEARNWLFPDRFPDNQKGQRRLLTELLEAHETLVQ